jgi:hypothetical protein
MGWEWVEGRFCVDGSTFLFICFGCFLLFPLRLWFVCLGDWTFGPRLSFPAAVSFASHARNVLTRISSPTPATVHLLT